ncbi:MAG: flavodoxin domain-containing protein [Methanobacterium sp.]|nr:flavodoxin domain-containing protein [Methanobacterium sp.]
MKALVVYGSRYGTAAEIAREIADVIENEGNEVDLKDVRAIKKFDVSPYDLIVVGSGIKMGKWTKGSLKFLKDNKSQLANKKVALFVSCGAANEEKSRDEGWENYLKKVATENLEREPVELGLFGSVYDPNAKHGLMYKLTNRFYKKELEKQGIDTTKRHDYRDWDEIRAWANNLAHS